MKDHEYRTTVLDSGLTVHTINIPSVPKIYYEVLVKSGAASEYGKTGVAHYLEHMFGYGSSQFGEKDMLPYFGKKGGEYNFTTSFIYTNYHAHALPHKVREYSERIATVLTDPIFTPDHVEKERSPILSEELQTRDRLKNDADVHLLPLMYGNHRHGNVVIGLPEDIARISYEDLRSYYDSVYVASNMHVIVVGDVEHDEWVRETERQYATLPQRPASITMEPLFIQGGTHRRQMDLEAMELRIGFVLPQTDALHAARDNIVSSLINQKLHEVLRDEKKLVYGAGAYMNTNGSEEILTIRTSLDPLKAEEVIGEIFATLTDYAKNITAQDIESFKANHEEFLADNHTYPRYQGSRLSSMLSHGRQYSSLIYEMEVAENITTDELRSCMRTMINGRAFMSVAASSVDIPSVNKYVNNMRKELAIDGIGANSNIKEEFNPTDP